MKVMFNAGSFSLNKSYSSNFFQVACVQGQKFFLMPLLVLIIATITSQKDFGEFIISFTLSQLMMICCDFGLNQKIIADSKGKFPSLILVLSMMLLKAMISFLCLALFSALIFVFFEEEFFLNFLWIVSGFIASQSNFFWAIFKANKNFYVEFQGASIASVMLVLLVAILYFFAELTSISLCLAFFFSRLVALFWSIFCFCREKEFRSHYDYSVKAYFEVIISSLKAVVPLAGLTVFAFGYIYFDLFIIKYFMDSEKVAVYQLAFRIIMLTMIAPEIFNNLFLPYLSKSKYEDFKKFLDLVKMSQKVLFLYAIFACIFLFIASKPVITYIFGVEYFESIFLIKILLPLVVLRCIGTPLGLALLVLDKLWFRFFALLSIAVAGAMANFLLVPNHGLLAVIFVSIVLHVVLNVFYWVAFYYHPQINDDVI